MFFILIIGAYGILEYIVSVVRWRTIAEINKDFGINKKNAYIDRLGYLRWKSNGKLCHRDIAYQYIYQKNKDEFPEPFSNYDIHHINKNKFDVRPENLSILTREQHQMAHNQLIIKNNRKYFIIGSGDDIVCETKKAILIRDHWLPKKEVLYRYDRIYLSEWLWEKYFKNQYSLWFPNI